MATCGATWEVSQRFDDLYAVTHGAGLYVAVGDHGALITSPDGITWTQRHLTDTDGGPQISGIVWNGSLFVAVGTGNTIFTSLDGITWTPRILDNSYTLQAITWGNGLFVAVGSGNTVLASPDGVTWTPRALDNSYTLQAITWGNGLFVAVGPGNHAVLTSPDGINWTPRALDDSYALQAITWGNGLFVAVGTGMPFGGAVLTSLDGITWTPRNWNGGSPEDTTYFKGVAWDGRQFVAIGNQYTEYSTGPGGYSTVPVDVLLTSPNGVTWVQNSPFDNDSIFTSVQVMIWSNGQFIAVGAVNTVLTSSDGIVWTSRTASTDSGILDVVWGNDQFVAIGANKVLNSLDGATWTASSLSEIGGLCAVTWGNGQFVAVSNESINYRFESHKLLASSDGKTWTLAFETSDMFTPARCAVTWGDGQFVALGFMGVLSSSPDGITWMSHGLGDLSPSAVTWGDGLFVAVGGPSVLTSPDGITWTPTWTPHNLDDFDYRLQAVTWGNGLFVVVGRDRDNGVILASPDGVTWSPHVLENSDRLYLSDVTWGNGRFVAVGTQYADDSDDHPVSVVLVSLDGVAWTRHTVDTGYSGLNAIAWNGSQFVAVGDRIILRSDCSHTDDPATTLITHYYVSILEREPEADGLAFWLNRIAENQAYGLSVKSVFRDMADFFFNSPEYIGRNTTDRQFITNLYLTFFQREPDDGGYAFWLEQLAKGGTRNQAMGSFLYSPEFTAFMEALGF